MRNITSLHRIVLFTAYALRASSAAYTTIPVSKKHHKSPAMTMMSTSSEVEHEIEIEKKFAVNDKTASVLKSYGFDIVQNEEFVDWYFDLAEPKFCLEDCWFRYREKKVKMMNNWGWRGAWQVKRGQKGTRENDGITTYEEFQGKVAKQLILDMLSTATEKDAKEVECTSSTDATPNSPYSTHDIPHLEGGEKLVPFARIETFRTSWKATTNSADNFSGLKVDIDKADSGYMVGEVEALLSDGGSSQADVENEKEKIKQFVDLITLDSECNAKATTIGKLEFVLMKERPNLYHDCVKAGVINEPK